MDAAEGASAISNLFHKEFSAEAFKILVLELSRKTHCLMSIHQFLDGSASSEAAKSHRESRTKMEGDTAVPPNAHFWILSLPTVPYICSFRQRIHLQTIARELPTFYSVCWLYSGLLTLLWTGLCRPCQKKSQTLQWGKLNYVLRIITANQAHLHNLFCFQDHTFTFQSGETKDKMAWERMRILALIGISGWKPWRTRRKKKPFVG